jgi:hypothetical protein
MTPITTTLREILATGKVGTLRVGMKRKDVADLIPELSPLNESEWHSSGFAIVFSGDVVWQFNFNPDRDDFRFPSNVNVLGYIPSKGTTPEQFIEYLEAEKLRYEAFWTGWDYQRSLELVVENKTYVLFSDKTSALVAIASYFDIEKEKKIIISASTSLNVFDLLTSHAEKGQILNRGYEYCPKNPLNPSVKLRPDVSYSETEKVAKDYKIEGVPDLAVVTVLPHQKADDVQEEVRAFLNEGTKQVWVIYPRIREIHQYRLDKLDYTHIFRGSQVIDTSGLFPSRKVITADDVFNLPKTIFRKTNNQ